MNYIRQSAAIAVASGVAVASLVSPAAAAKAPAAKTPAAAAASYLVGQLAGKHHDHLVDLYKGTAYTDDGETADAVLSLDAAGVAQSKAAKMTKWLEKDATNYIQAGDPAPDFLPGAIAKLMLVAEAQHIDPGKFGGTDLVGELVGDEDAGSGTLPGQYQDPGETSYGSSMLIQSLAELALADLPSDPAQPSADARAFLASQQCADGGYQLDVRADTTTACTAEDVDATAYAVQALIAIGSHDAATKAVTWLTDAQNKNGGWPEEVGDKSDANSTAIAYEALVAAKVANKQPVKYLEKLQLGCGSKPKKGLGAVTLQGSYNVGTATRATSQAGVALAGKSLAKVDKKGASTKVPVVSCPKKRRSSSR